MRMKYALQSPVVTTSAGSRPNRHTSRNLSDRAHSPVDVQRTHRLFIADAADRLGQQLRDRQLPDAAHGLRRIALSGIVSVTTNSSSSDFAMLLEGRPRQDRMGDVGDHLERPSSRSAPCAAWYSVPAVSTMSSTSMQVLPSTSPMMFMTLRLVRPRTALVDDRQFRVVKALARSARARATPSTSGRHHDRPFAYALLPGVPQQHRGGVHVVHRDVEEALDLVRVQVHRQRAGPRPRWRPCWPPASPRGDR